MQKILITNDDGIQSDGIIRLARAAKKYGKVWVVAPDGQRSAMSHRITLRETIEFFPVDFPVEGVHAYASTGTPADCVRFGILNIVKEKPDYVFSGINYGYNSGTDIQYSATVGSALEAACAGVHAIAFSEGASECHEVTDAYLEQMLKELNMNDEVKDAIISKKGFMGKLLTIILKNEEGDEIDNDLPVMLADENLSKKKLRFLRLR